LSRTLSICWLSAAAVALLAGAAVARTGAAVGLGGPSRAGEQAGRASISSVRVKRFAIRDAEMEEALRSLRRQDVSRILIGFERVPRRQGERGHRISLALRDAGAVRIVQRLCEADPRYEYEVIEGSMIEVRPRAANSDPRDLLNLEISDYGVDRRVLPQDLIEQIGWQAPELRELLAHKQEERARKTGRRPGVAGSILSGNVPPPTFILRVRHATVREVLNAIALHSLEMFREGKLAGPTGWEYDFVIDPRAYTGLGGYPRWIVF
jgi:hypothetical protein